MGLRECSGGAFWRVALQTTPEMSAAWFLFGWLLSVSSRRPAPHPGPLMLSPFRYSNAYATDLAGAKHAALSLAPWYAPAAGVFVVLIAHTRQAHQSPSASTSELPFEVGAAVSAKYRGAWCEGTITEVARSLEAKVGQKRLTVPLSSPACPLPKANHAVRVCLLDPCLSESIRPAWSDESCRLPLREAGARTQSKRKKFAGLSPSE
jgi:hypothetical protein